MPPNLFSKTWLALTVPGAVDVLFSTVHEPIFVMASTGGRTHVSDTTDGGLIVTVDRNWERDDYSHAILACHIQDELEIFSSRSIYGGLGFGRRLRRDLQLASLV